MRSLIQDLMRGAVHVWHVSPETLGTSPASCLGLLSPDERERWEAFAFERDRELFLLGKVLVRTVLGRYFDVPAPEWRFVSTALGKPHIDRPESTRSLQFSLSHTEGLVACAVRWQRAVGIDVEYTGRVLEWDRVACQFAPEEYQQLARRPKHRRREAFFALWTLKEAHAKACGHGLSLGLQACRFELAEDCSLRAADPGRGESPWTFFCPRLSREHRVAVAAEHGADIVPTLRVCPTRSAASKLIADGSDRRFLNELETEGVTTDAPVRGQEPGPDGACRGRSALRFRHVTPRASGAGEHGEGT